MRNIYLIRHEEREDTANPGWKATARYPHDCPLSEEGKHRAKILAQSLDVNHVVTSPFLRTR